MTYITYIIDTTNIWKLKYDTKELIQIRLLEHKKKNKVMITFLESSVEDKL